MELFNNKCFWKKKQKKKKHSLTTSFVKFVVQSLPSADTLKVWFVDFGFYIPPNAKVIWRRALSLDKSGPDMMLVLTAIANIYYIFQKERFSSKTLTVTDNNMANFLVCKEF